MSFEKLIKKSLKSEHEYVVYIGNGFESLTKGKTYKVLKDHGSYYSLKNDFGYISTPSKSSPEQNYFISLREYNLNKLLE